MSLQLDALDRLDLASAQLRALLTAAPVSTAIPVKPSDNLLALMAAAPTGAVFTLDAACLFLVPSLVISKPVTLQCAVDPGPSRVNAVMVGPILRGDLTVTAPGVSFVGLRLEGAVKEATILTTGPGTIIDRCVVLGSAQGQHRGVAVNSANVSITKSYVGNIWSASQDAQAIAGWTGTRNLLVDDCYLEASAENIIFGGTDNASADLNPQDLIISNCALSKNLAWFSQPGVICKNLFELKNAQRVQLKGCTGTYSWPGGGQVGNAIALTVRNQDGGSPWANVTDVLIQDCAFSQLGAGINILGTDDTHPSGVMQNITIRRVTLNIDPSVRGGSGRQVMIAGGPVNLLFDTLICRGAHFNSAFTFDNPALKTSRLSVQGCTLAEGDYGITGGPTVAIGQPVLDLYAPGFTWTSNTIVRNPGGLRSDGSAVGTIPYPPGTTLI